MFRKLVVLSLVAAVAALSPVLAAEKFKIFVDAAWVSPLGDTTFSDLDDIDLEGTYEAADAVGWNFGFEWRWTELLGVEVDYLMSSNDVEVDGETTGELDVNPLSASLNIHLIHADFDLWVAPTISWVNFDAEDTSVDSEFAYGATLGAAFYFTDRFGIEGAIRYLDLSADAEDLGSVAIDPLIARAGVAFRF